MCGEEVRRQEGRFGAQLPPAARLSKPRFLAASVAAQLVDSPLSRVRAPACQGLGPLASCPLCDGERSETRNCQCSGGAPGRGLARRAGHGKSDGSLMVTPVDGATVNARAIAFTFQAMPRDAGWSGLDRAERAGYGKEDGERCARGRCERRGCDAFHLSVGQNTSPASTLRVHLIIGYRYE